MLDNIKLAADAATLSPIALFLQADWIVKGVMIGLLLASIYVWAVIFTHGRSVGKLMGASERFERDFWRAGNLDKFYDENGREELPSAKILAAGISEWRRSTAGKNVDRDGTRERLGIAMNAAIAGEVDRLAEKIGTLATIGSVAPFVGLFGTVWGIMRSFTAIAASNNSSLAVVAPGIAEALFATAIGLFAAIPAVIAYNAFSQRLNRLESRLGRFADGLHATFSRELEVEA
ncbi:MULTISPECIES: protein TolQ [Sphingopyxis]|uniref:Protein TolQ n=1 Tax=Sphingopyxis macrogoltabida TaxID=33050 RepID=A0AAC9AW12_SPHMC|nr:protein TolQ [Sphingopyxis macrogoltabida]ALJ14667.1 biopolymer transporter ExbB [Sphingopyxis macrogoltabida]AMU90927.1 protein TolQ [Sphingopyxis macrogoltabida]